MRWIIVAGLTGMLIGLCGGVTLGVSIGRSAIVEASAAPFAPE
jgi:ABC-type nitrate/sulfonate/bicarbonate transport system permease component